MKKYDKTIIPYLQNSLVYLLEFSAKTPFNFSSAQKWWLQDSLVRKSSNPSSSAKKLLRSWLEKLQWYCSSASISTSTIVDSMAFRWRIFSAPADYMLKLILIPRDRWVSLRVWQYQYHHCSWGTNTSYYSIAFFATIEPFLASENLTWICFSPYCNSCNPQTQFLGSNKQSPQTVSSHHAKIVRWLHCTTSQPCWVVCVQIMNQFERNLMNTNLSNAGNSSNRMSRKLSDKRFLSSHHLTSKEVWTSFFSYSEDRNISSLQLLLLLFRTGQTNFRTHWGQSWLVILFSDCFKTLSRTKKTVNALQLPILTQNWPLIISSSLSAVPLVFGTLKAKSSFIALV